MATPFTLTNWNDLLDKVNSVLSDPPEGCETPEGIPLEHLDGKKPFRKSDVQAVQNVLAAACPNVQFSPLKLWTQTMIDELNTALGQAWCQCQNSGGGGGTGNNGGGGSGNGITVYVNCYVPTGQVVEGANGFLTQVAPAGCTAPCGGEVGYIPSFAVVFRPESSVPATRQVEVGQYACYQGSLEEWHFTE
ncbi:MAG TPA: hypothetical protein VG826_05295 [Pirellulales bacterium]|nr:hypothetical protein [Pirellulales bacterium]